MALETLGTVILKRSPGNEQFSSGSLETELFEMGTTE